jgi:predicted ATPase/DNA-binding CsgD family transcriptional regulator
MIGRAREHAAVRDLLLRPDVPIVTVTGPGGVGKTRLALHVAADLTDRFADGLRFIPLSAINDAELVVPAIAQGLGLTGLGGQSAEVGLRDYLQDRELLLVLDNMEHVIGAAPALSGLLRDCPSLTLLVTSRETLRVEGEQEYPLKPLAVPDTDTRATAESVAGADAVALFVQRARAAQPDFALDEGNAATVAAICSRLDGLPLAIELAAPRIKMLPPQELLNRLANRFNLLSRDARDMPARLRTMRDAVGWSYDLLSLEEQALFRQLSVFGGGFSLEAAEALFDESSEPAGSILERISSLEEKSLVRRVEDSTAPRFGMLETIRRFGFELLVAYGESDAALNAMSAWCQDLFSSGFDQMFGPDQGAWLTIFDAEYDNVRTALGWLLDQGEAARAQRLSVAMGRYWYVRGYFGEGKNWIERALAAGPADRWSYGSALLIGGWLALQLGDYASAERMVKEGTGLAQELADQHWRGQILTVTGLVLEDRGRIEEAVGRYEEALAVYRSIGDIVWPAYVLNALGLAAYRQGDLERAVPYFRESLAEFREGGNSFGEGLVLMNLGRVAKRRGEYAEAHRLIVGSLALRWAQGDRPGILSCLRGLATLALLTGEHAHAARLLGAAEGLRSEIAAPEPRQHDRYDRAITQARSALGDDAFAAAKKTGMETPLPEIVAGILNGEGPDTGRAASPDQAKRSGLTSREIEVLRLIRDGLSNREIGERLFVSERTAQTHVQHILDKLDVGTRAEAAADAVERGLI